MNNKNKLEDKIFKFCFLKNSLILDNTLLALFKNTLKDKNCKNVNNERCITKFD